MPAPKTPRQQWVEHVDEWKDTGRHHGWDMPSAPAWKRLPIVRHVRTLYHSYKVQAWDDFWWGMGLMATGYDDWVLWGMWNGMENAMPARRHSA